METIWKYTLELKPKTELHIPIGAKFLSGQIQKDEICLWFEVDTEREKEPRTFGIIGTNHEIDGDLYLATVLMSPFVWHIYEYLK